MHRKLNNSRRPGESRALERLLRLLETGEYPPGSRLPPERELCELCGVSRMTLRRALVHLGEVGRVESQQGSGTFVTCPSAESNHRDIALMYTTNDAAVAGLVRRAEAAGCGVRIHWQADFQWQSEAERRFLREVRDRRLRGLLAFCTPNRPHNDDLLRDLENCGIRVLHIEHYRPEPPEQPCLLPDFRRAGHMAAVRLMIAGYRNLYYLGYPHEKTPLEWLLRQGFADALHEHRPDLDPAACEIEFPQIRGAIRNTTDYRRRLEQIMSELPPESGLLLHNIRHGEGLVTAARRVGTDIPRQCGIVGIDVAGGGRVERQQASIDSLSFDRPALLNRALDLLLADEWCPPRELVMPAYVRGETVRER